MCRGRHAVCDWRAAARRRARRDGKVASGRQESFRSLRRRVGEAGGGEGRVTASGVHRAVCMRLSVAVARTSKGAFPGRALRAYKAVRGSGACVD